jgi:FkbM family methyltransferase
MLVVANLDVGGVQRVNVNLANGLAAAGHPVVLVVVGTAGPLAGGLRDPLRTREKIRPAAGRVALVELGAKRASFALAAIAAEIDARNPDVVISSQQFLNVAVLMAVDLAKAKPPVIVREDNCLSTNEASEHPGWWNGRLMPTAASVAYQRASHVVAVSQGVANDLVSRLGTNPFHLSVVANPVVEPGATAVLSPPNHHFFADRDASAAKLQDLRDQPSVLVAAGRLVPAKAFHDLLDAFALVTDPPNTRLVILGEGPERARLEQRAAQLGLTAQVDLPGSVSDPLNYFAHADCFVLSSVREGLPTVLVEALSVGTPVVATDCTSGPREILDDGRLGVLVPPGDVHAMASAISTVLTTPQKPKSEEIHPRFTVAGATEQYRQLIAKAVAAGPGVPVEASVEQARGRVEAICRNELELPVRRAAVQRIGATRAARVAAKRSRRSAVVSARQAFGQQVQVCDVPYGTLELPVDDPGVANELLQRGVREPEHTWFFRRCVGRATTVLEVGANFGYHTLALAHLVGSSGRVIALEPNPTTASYLGRNVQRNAMQARVEVHQLAADTTTATAQLRLSARSNWHTIEADPAHRQRREMQAQATITVPTTDFVQAIATREVRVVRMDIEGYEQTLLADLAQRAREVPKLPTVVMETHPEYYAHEGEEFAHTLRQLADAGIRPKWLAVDRVHAAGTGRVLEWCGFAPELVAAEFPEVDRCIYEVPAERIDEAIDLIATSAVVHAAVLG